MNMITAAAFACVVIIISNFGLTTYLHMPAIIYRGELNSFSVLWSLFYIPINFIIWQICIGIFIYKKRKELVINICCALSFIYSIGIYFLFPAKF